MSDPVPSRLPGDIHLTDLDVSLERGDAKHPLQPVVQGLRLRLSARGLRELAQALVDEADRRGPVTIKLIDARVGPNGIDLYLRVEKMFFGSDLSTRLTLSAPGGRELGVALTDTDLPGWVPLDRLLDEAVKRGGGAVRRDPEHPRALLLDPAVLLAQGGLPGRFAPGRWGVASSANGIDLAFQSMPESA